MLKVGNGFVGWAHSISNGDMGIDHVIQLSIYHITSRPDPSTLNQGHIWCWHVWKVDVAEMDVA